MVPGNMDKRRAHSSSSSSHPSFIQILGEKVIWRRRMCTWNSSPSLTQIPLLQKRLWPSTASWSSMDDHTKKRPADGLKLSKRSSGLSFRDPKNEKRNFHDCNRTGWSTGDNATKSTQNSSSEKLKYLKSPLRFKSSNPNAASSSRSSSASNYLKMSCHERKNGETLEETIISECGNRQGEDKDRLKFDLEFRGRKNETEYSQSLKPPILHSFPSSSTKMLSNFNPTFASRYGKQISQSSVSAAQENANLPARPSIPQVISQMPKFIPHATGGPQRYGLKSFGCASFSDALSLGSSSDEHNKTAVSLRKKIHDGEGSSSGMPSLQMQQVPDDTSRKTKSQYNSRDATVSGRTCLSSGGESSRMRLNEQEDEHIFELPGPIMYQMRPHAPLVISEVVQQRLPLPFDFQNVSFAGRSRSNSRSSRRMSVSHSADVGDYLHSTVEGFSEVLQVLERFEQDEELTYEQLMVLEANLLEGFSLYDQHRDMRLDIDNMSYEDLLALEEKMGSVSTALPDEDLSKCLKKCTYRTNFLHMPGISAHGDDDFKCSICQEEYMIGEELGSLPCKHHYHVTCIQKWLRLKNWCPICKAPVLP